MKPTIVTAPRSPMTPAQRQALIELFARALVADLRADAEAHAAATSLPSADVCTPPS